MDCESCKSKKPVEPVPYIVHESAMARNERTVKRLVVALIVVVCLWFATIGVGAYAWLQYDYTSEETAFTQDGEGLNIIGDRNTAGVYGADSTD